MLAVVFLTQAARHSGPPRWFLVLWRDEVALSDVTRVRPSRMGQRQMAGVELRDRRPLLVPVRYGFDRLVDALRAGAPGLQVDA